MQHRMRAAIGIVATSAVLLAGCSSSGSSKSGSSGSTGSKGGSAKTVAWAKAQSAQAGGGHDALVAAAKKEGTLNVIALPPTWANYANIIASFKKQYGIKITSENPDGSSGDEINALKSTKGQSSAPDVVDVGNSFAVSGARAGPVRAVQGRDLGLHPGRPEGLRRPLDQRLRRLHLDRLQRQQGQGLPDDDQGARQPDVQGPGRAQRRPDGSANAAFEAVWAAALANGGSADQHPARHRLLPQAEPEGHLQQDEGVPVDRRVRRDADRARLGLPERRRGPDPQGQERHLEGRRPLGRARVRLLRAGDQHQRPAPGRRAALGGVPVQPGARRTARTSGCRATPARSS